MCLVANAAPARTQGRTTGILRHQSFYHTAWNSGSGLGAVFDIEQANDGFLWMATSTGIFRFDGVHFESIGTSTDGAIRDNTVNAFHLSRTGGIWFSTRSAGLLFWNQGRVTAFPDRRCTPALFANGIQEGLDGSLWIHASGGLFHLVGKTCEHIAAERGFPEGFVATILMDHRGTLWVVTGTGALLFLPNGENRFRDSQVNPGTSVGSVFLREAPDGSIWLSDDHGLRRVIDAHGNAVTVPETYARKLPREGDFAFASDGTLWVATKEGVERFTHMDRGEIGPELENVADQRYSLDDGLSSDAVERMFVDREGSVWIGTNGGLDRLRQTPLTTIVLPHTQEFEFAIAPGKGGSIWIGNKSMDLAEIDPSGKLTSYPATLKPVAIRRDFRGMIWASGDGPAHLLRYDGTSFVPVHYPGEEQALVVSLGVDRNDEVWISRIGPEIFHLSHGTWTKENQALGRKPNVLGATASDSDGNVWFAFSNQLVEWTGSEFKKYSFTGDNVSPSTIAVRGSHVWLAGEGGVQLFSNGTFRILRWNDPSLPGKVSGVLETETGDLWLNGFSGITHVSSAELKRWLQEPGSSLTAERLNAVDGLPGLSAERFPEPSLIEGDDGRIWFATTKGVAWLNPAQLDETFNAVPPEVEITSVMSGTKRYTNLEDVTLPPKPHDIEIDYTALSLALPERVNFRYKLDGVDQDWQQVGTRREAFYTKLQPGDYLFQVIACNNSGVWNNTGAKFLFHVAPAWYQTRLFSVLVMTIVILGLWLLHRLRLRQIALAMNVRFDERLAERTRMARELHDTFLQTVQGSKMVVEDALTPSADEARMRRALEKLSQWLTQAVDEGRAALHALRVSTIEENHLSEALQRAAEDPQVPSSMHVSFSTLGDARDLHPIVRDEIYRIAFEAIRNAALHSKASQLQIEIRYADDLTILVGDNGVGIDPSISDSGKAGHFGLQGMRERAARIHGKLAIRSSVNSGTSVTLTVPGHVVYRNRRPSFFEGLKDRVARNLGRSRVDRF